MASLKTLSLTVLLVMLATGAAAQAPPPQTPPPDAAPPQAQPEGSRREVMRLYIVQRMRETLALSDAQTLKAMEILEAIDKQRAANQSDMRSVMEEIRRQIQNPAATDDRFKELVAEFQKRQVRNEASTRELENRLMAVLTPRQQAQFIVLRRQLLEEMREEGAGGRSRPGRPGGPWGR